MRDFEEPLGGEPRQEPWVGNENLTSVREFILEGLTNHRKTQIFLFLIILLIYSLTVMGNLAIIMLVRADSSLHNPMYFFLANLSALEICYVTCSMPQMLAHLLSGNGAISFNRCMLQMYMTVCLGSVECFLLGAMAYDRYLAICHPLLYVVAMSRWRQVQLASASWVSGFLLTSINVGFILHLPYCGPNRINHFFCDMPIVLKLACTDIRVTERHVVLVAALIVVIPFFIILTSYMLILSSVIRMRSAAGRRKAFSTCASHLVVVILFYGILIFVYLMPGSDTAPDQDKKLAVFYIVITPLLNPIIYTLRNKDIHGAVSRMLQRWRFKHK
ncbi:olfactory receptor 2G3-like [Eublepharis macularius]|uniref:Olfactory receptor n=1 Tax=Eublepharis macularius TaxID=481883 RepID=A0AA97K845_EUBMA|nr:olfactory receptor 2G3-like [Eublepharis macularius]